MLTRHSVLCSFFLLSTLIPGWGQAQAPPQNQIRIETSARVVAIADIHGAFDGFVRLLQKAGLIGSQRQWSGGSAHLVIVGDMLDRGPDSRQVMDLLMSLESSAREAGGAVHVLLGNHEIMNLVGERTYVSRAEFAAYQDMVPPGMRESALRRFADQNNDDADDPELQAEFNRAYPPGYFGHYSAFSPAGTYGRWLLEKPVFLTINDTGFAHAGISEQLARLSAIDVNRLSTDVLRAYAMGRQEMIAAGLFDPETGFAEQYERSGEIADDNDFSSVQRDLAKRLHSQWEDSLFGPDGVVWYRGMVACSPALEQGRLEAILGHLGLSRLVIGHTPTNTFQVQSRFGGSLLRADTGMYTDHYGGQPAAVEIDGDQLRIHYLDENLPGLPLEQPRAVGNRPLALPDEELEAQLREAAVLSSSRQFGGTRLLEMEGELGRFQAVFRAAADDREDRLLIPEVAAYRLDRLLNLELVPVAVRRTVDGRVGAVYIDNSDLISESRREAVQASASWCPMDDQFQLMYIFDGLLSRGRRAAEDMRYNPNDWQLVLTDNRNILNTRDSLPRYLRNTELLMSRNLQDSLTRLTPALLERELADVMSAGRREALLLRRDALLQRREP